MDERGERSSERLARERPLLPDLTDPESSLSPFENAELDSRGLSVFAVPGIFDLQRLAPVKLSAHW